MSGLTHVDADGRARMVDVGGKPETRREAVAEGRLETTAEVVRLLTADALPKADALATARIAGIAGTKRTGDLIPLCHPLPIDAASVDLVPEGAAVRITARVSTTGRTGVEMEALTAVAIAALTLHDMVKAVDPAATTTGVRLVEKTGGKRGRWTRPGAEPAVPRRRAGGGRVLVLSTGAASGGRADTTGPRIADWLRGLDLEVPDAVVAADADVAGALRDLLADGPDVVITTGGTGASPSDRTPEATSALLDRPLPGVAEALRARGGTPTAALSRGVAGLAGSTVVVNLPGSPGGVDDGLTVLADLLPHLLRQVRGRADHEHGAHQSDPHPVDPHGAHPHPADPLASDRPGADPHDAGADS